MVMALEIRPECYYRAIWFWEFNGAVFLAACWRDGDDELVTVACDAWDLDQTWLKKQSGMSPEERDQALTYAYEASRKAAEKRGMRPPGEPVRMVLECGGVEAAQKLMNLTPECRPAGCVVN